MKNKKKQREQEVRVYAHKGAATLCLILVLAGLGLSIYLLRLHYALAAKQSISGFNVCSAFGGNCESTLTSAAAVQFGLPLAGWGLIYFAILLSMLLFGRLLKESFDAQSRAAAFLIAIPGVMISAILLYMMLSGRSPFCPICTTIHVINFVLLYLLKRQTGQSFSEIFASIFPKSESEEISQQRTGYLAYFSVALIAFASYEGLLLREAKPAAVVAEKKPDASELERIQGLLQSTDQQRIPVGPEDPVQGDSSAPVQLVIFSDYQCPACRGYELELTQIKQTYGNKIQFVFKNFPLDKACNPVVNRDIHIHACEAAFSAEAARKQGKFWIYHDELFIADLESPGVFDSLGQSVGLDMEHFKADRDSEAVKAKVRADIDQGVNADVNATPSIFLNGRHVLDIRPEILRFLIDQILAKQKK